jgi:hypothetical protein
MIMLLDVLGRMRTKLTKTANTLPWPRGLRYLDRLRRAGDRVDSIIRSPWAQWDRTRCSEGEMDI